VRTTVTLDADTANLVRQLMEERRISFKQAINEAIRAGAASHADTEPFHTVAARMGRSRVNLDRAVQLAAEIEDEELVRKMRTGS
jgi:hypothetical protein